MYILQNTVCVIWSHIKKKKKCSLFPNEPSSCWIDNNFPNLVKTHFFFFSLILDGYMKGCCTTGFDIKFVWKVFSPLLICLLVFYSEKEIKTRKCVTWVIDRAEKCFLSFLLLWIVLKSICNAPCFWVYSKKLHICLF